LFRPHQTISSEVFQGIFAHLVYNSALIWHPVVVSLYICMYICVYSYICYKESIAGTQTWRAVFAVISSQLWNTQHIGSGCNAWVVFVLHLV